MPKTKDGVYVIKTDEYKSTGTNWIALYVRAYNYAIYFNTFWADNISKEIKKFIGQKNIPRNIFRIQAFHLKMSGYFCIGIIGFILKGKSLLEYTSYFLQVNMKRMAK